MKTKLFMMLAILFISLNVLFVDKASAAYDSSSDLTVSVTVLEDVIQTSDTTGDFTFKAQEDLHQLITNSTGQEIDHSYVWIKVNGHKLLAVDPPKPCY
jgi:hypothetical protein